MKKNLFKKLLPVCLVISIFLGFATTSLVYAGRITCKESPSGQHEWSYKGRDTKGHDVYQCIWCHIFDVE